MAKNQKKTNQVLVIGVVGLGAYALYKTVINPDIPFGEGALGGSDSLYDDLPQHEKSWVAEIFDPNTIPEQPTADIYPTYDIPQDSSPTYDPTPTPSYNFSPYVGSSTPEPTPILNDGGFLGTGVTAPQWGLGLLGLTSTPFTKLPKHLGRTTDLGTAWKRASREALEETPVAGRRLGEFAFDGSKAGTRVSSAVTGEVAQTGFRAGLKRIGTRIGGLGVKSIPFFGAVAGSEFDVMVDGRPRWLAYPTNIAGDVVGGGIALATSPLALTGVGVTVPVAGAIAGQVGTEMVIYGAYDRLTTPMTPEQQRELFIQTQQMTNQGTMVDDEFWGNQYDNIVSPSNVGGAFNLAESSKNISFGATTLNQTKGTSTPFQLTSPISSNQSVFSSQVNKPKSGAISQSLNIGSATNRSSTPINTSRFVAQSGGGYSDTVAQQSVSREVAQERSNVFSRTARSGATTTTSQAMTPARATTTQTSSNVFRASTPATSSPARSSTPATTTSAPARTSPTPVQAVRSTASAVASRVTSTTSAVASRVTTTASNVRSTATNVRSTVTSWFRR